MWRMYLIQTQVKQNGTETKFFLTESGKSRIRSNIYQFSNIWLFLREVEVETDWGEN